jgi:hypothetical protein
MGAAYNVTVSSPERGPLLVRERGRGRAASRAIFFLYVLALGGVSLHLYRTPIYSMDSIQYMGNALLMEETDIVRVHQRVYAEVERYVPKVPRDGLLGYEVGAPADQNKSRQERAANPARFAEFLPLFAIRPLYNQTLWLVSRAGLGLVRAGVVISVGSYFLLGILIYIWIRAHAHPGFALGFSILLMMCPPMTILARDTTSDALATLIAFLAMYLIFEKQRLAAGMALLLASIYFRTDFVVLAGPTILACWLERRIELWKAAVLSLVAVASVLCINHFAGDYGIRMLYYRAFVTTPIAPGEMVPHFSFRDYVSAFRAGITMVTSSFFLPFLLLGTISALARRMRVLFAVAVAYAGLHFVILPSWEERYCGLFYVAMGVCAAVTAGAAVGNAKAGCDTAE